MAWRQRTPALGRSSSLEWKVDRPSLLSSGVFMTSEVVNLEVSVSIPINCDFWSEDDGWKGLCKTLSVTVRGSSFEDAKKNMAGELQLRIEGILREHAKKSVRRIA
jgi:hypothetical protein